MPSSTSTAHVATERLRKVYGGQTALECVDLQIARAEIAVIIGGSGAGKTTLLRLLIGLESPSDGKVLIDGEDITTFGERRMNEVRKKFGMVFQYAALLDSLTVLENVAFPLREHTLLRESEIRQKVAAQLSILGLSGTEDKFPSELSGGMRKRVGLARALMLEPEIIVYDEPTSGLDPLTSRRVDDLIVETRDRFGVTSIVISHDMTSALKIADRVFLLSSGRIVAEGTPAQFLRSRDPLVVDFLRASGVVGSGGAGDSARTSETSAEQQPGAVEYKRA